MTFDYLRGDATGRVSKAAATVSEWLTVRALGSADLACCTTQSQSDELSRRGLKKSPLIIRNGLEAATLKKLREVCSVRTSPEFPVSARFLYAGTLGYAQDPEQLLEIARLAPDVHLTFVGSGPLEPALRASAATLHNVTVQAPVSFDELADIYRENDVLVACLRHRPEFLTAVPSKLYEYAATGRLMLFVGEGEAAEIARSLGGVACSSITDDTVYKLVQQVKSGEPRFSVAPMKIPIREESAAQLVRAIEAR